jgi:hypothetical protein
MYPFPTNLPRRNGQAGILMHIFVHEPGIASDVREVFK